MHLNSSKKQSAISPEHRTAVADDELISLPFYGGAKGQVLQIKRGTDGSVKSEIVKQDAATVAKDITDDMSSFQLNLESIQKAASELVTLQQNIKLSGGKLTAEDRKVYAENLEKLGVSAQNLAHIQEASGKDDFRQLFEGPMGHRIKESTQAALDRLEGINKKPSGSKEEEDEENVGEEEDENDNGDEEHTDEEDSVGVNEPAKDASVAEAKPVGMNMHKHLYLSIVIILFFLKVLLLLVKVVWLLQSQLLPRLLDPVVWP